MENFHDSYSNSKSDHKVSRPMKLALNSPEAWPTPQEAASFPTSKSRKISPYNKYQSDSARMQAPNLAPFLVTSEGLSPVAKKADQLDGHLQVLNGSSDNNRSLSVKPSYRSVLCGAVSSDNAPSQAYFDLPPVPNSTEVPQITQESNVKPVTWDVVTVALLRRNSGENIAFASKVSPRITHPSDGDSNLKPLSSLSSASTLSASLTDSISSSFSSETDSSNDEENDYRTSSTLSDSDSEAHHSESDWAQTEEDEHEPHNGTASRDHQPSDSTLPDSDGTTTGDKKKTGKKSHRASTSAKIKDQLSVARGKVTELALGIFDLAKHAFEKKPPRSDRGKGAVDGESQEGTEEDSKHQGLMNAYLGSSGIILL